MKTRVRATLNAGVAALRRENRRMKDALQHSESYFRAITERSSEMVTVIGADLLVRYHSEAVLPLLGYRADELVGRSVFKLMHPDDAPRVAAMLQEGLASGRTEGRTTYRVRHRDGSWRVLEGVARNLTDNPAVRGVVINSRDVSERVAAEEALRESETRYRALAAELQQREARFRAMIERAVDWVSIWDASGDALYASPPLLAQFGLAPVALPNMHVLDGVHPDDRDRVWQVFCSLASRPDHVESIRFKVGHPDGSTHLIQGTATNLLGEPAVQGVVVNSRDITEQEQLETQLRLSQRLEAVGRLAGGVAHDFNNILTVIKASAEFLLSGLPEGQTSGRDDAEEILRSANRATGLTRQLLAFSRRQVLQPTVIDLQAVVSDMEKMLLRLIGEDIALTMIRSEGPLYVMADVAQLEQVVLNLVVNAREAMPGGGRLLIDTRLIPVDAAFAAAHAGLTVGPHAEISICDTGVGMTAEVRDRVFEPFFTTKEHGSGIGLATVYGIVRQSGGAVWVESEVGHGTTMNVYLPVVDAAVTEPEQPEGAQLHGTETVLVAEDEPVVRELVRRTLERFGYRVLVAPNADEALSCAAAHPGTIHLLLTDVVMPGGSGPELADQLKRVRSGTRVLYMSGYTADAISTRGVLNPGLQLIEKPFSPPELVRRVRQALAAPHTASAVV